LASRDASDRRPPEVPAREVGRPGTRPRMGLEARRGPVTKSSTRTGVRRSSRCLPGPSPRAASDAPGQAGPVPALRAIQPRRASGPGKESGSGWGARWKRFRPRSGPRKKKAGAARARPHRRACGRALSSVPCAHWSRREPRPAQRKRRGNARGAGPSGPRTEVELGSEGRAQPLGRARAPGAAVPSLERRELDAARESPLERLGP